MNRCCRATDCRAIIPPEAHGLRQFCSARCRYRDEARRQFTATHKAGRKEPITAPRGASVDERFWVKVDHRDGCWLWIGATDQHGYGLFRADGHHRAHRWSYERWCTRIGKGMTIDHLCRNKSCVNPSHLEIVSRSENARRGQLSVSA